MDLRSRNLSKGDPNLNFKQDTQQLQNKSKMRKIKFAHVLNCIFFLSGFVISTIIFTSLNLQNLTSQQENIGPVTDKYIQTSEHRLAIVVPFRDRFNELLKFVPHISKFLKMKNINFKIFIVNQVDDFRFNRASLINVGYLASMKECDYMAMHDVDLLPLNDQLDYGYPEEGPYHVSTSGLHPEYNYPKFIGGILVINRNHFYKTNGMSNRYWGWGKEDDEFYMRLTEANLTVIRPNLKEFKTNRENTFFHNHDAEQRPRDKKRYFKQRQESLILDQTGLNDIQYRIESANEISIDGYSCTIINTRLFCDRSDTHWCNNKYQFL